MCTLITENAAETKALGEKIGRQLRGGEVIALTGELGAGKTCLTQGLALGLGVDAREYVTSPTFTLINEYQGRVPLYHIDLFRLEDMEETENLGCEECFYGKGITVVEWAEKAETILPEEYLSIELTPLDENRRQIVLKPLGKRYRDILEGIGK